MQKKYDVIVIGAGLGGLSTAAYLAKQGKSVLVLEKNPVPGGYATSFVRGRYEFEVSLHALSGIGTPGLRGDLYQYLESLELTDLIEFREIKELCRSIFDDFEITLPTGMDSYKASLCEAFPHEAKGISEFLRYLHAVCTEALEIDQRRTLGSPLHVMSRYGELLRAFPARWSAILNRYIKDKRLRAVISQQWGYLGLGPGSVSFLYMALTLHGFLTYGANYIQGRSQALSNAFVRICEKYGGEVICNCAVTRIITDNGSVRGVVSGRDDEIMADCIVSNADPITTCTGLINREKIPSSFFRRLRASLIGPSTINVYLGVACSAQALGFRAHENFVNRNYDMESHYKKTYSLEPPDSVLVTCYNCTSADVSPPGTALVTLTAISYGKPWCSLSTDDYHRIKHSLGNYMIGFAEKIAPSLRNYIETIEIATPVTNMRYTGAMGGSIYGFSNTPHDHTVLRLDQIGPLHNLFFVGAWTQPGGGYEPCIMSGKRVAEYIISQSKR